MKAMINAALILASLTGGNFASAADFSVRITNLTNGIWFTPFVVAAHPDGTSLFTAGQPASASLQSMAEGGDISGLVADLQAVGATISENPAGGLLPPAMSADVDLNTDGTSNVLLSVAAMLLPTNDAFTGLNSITIPTNPGTYTFDLPAYDAGTEANDEIINGGGAPGTPGIPAAPGGDAGVDATGIADNQSNANVHIHRGVLGDDNLTGGSSDLDNRIHRWLNPVAKVTIIVE